MADIDIDPFGEHDRTESRTDEPMDEHIPLIPGEGGSTWEPERGEQETSFGGTSRTSVLHKEYLVGEIYELIGNKIHQKLEPNLCLFKLGKDDGLYYRGKPLTNRNGDLKMIGVIVDTLGIRGLQEMGYNMVLGQNPPRQNPPDKIPWTKSPWTKSPLGQNPPRQNPTGQNPPDKIPPLYSIYNIPLPPRF